VKGQILSTIHTVGGSKKDLKVGGRGGGGKKVKGRGKKHQHKVPRWGDNKVGGVKRRDLH